MADWESLHAFLTGDRIDDCGGKCTLLKRQTNYDSFHIKQTYLRQRALRAPSTSTDSITNWPANHLAPASKVQIRYLRSLKEDSTVCSAPLFTIIRAMFRPESRKKKSLGSLFVRHEKDLGWFSRASKNRDYFTAKILHASRNSPLILPVWKDSVAAGSPLWREGGETSQGLWGNLIDIYSSNDD